MNVMIFSNEYDKNRNPIKHNCIINTIHQCLTTLLNVFNYCCCFLSFQLKFYKSTKKSMNKMSAFEKCDNTLGTT